MNSVGIGARPGPSHALRVILVEDDRDLRAGLAGYLRASGANVAEAENGESFFGALRTGTFDVAILDVNLPDHSGFDLARRVSAVRRMGIVMLTARSGVSDRIQGYADGADIYLTKPVHGQELLLAVRNLARRVREGDAGRWADASVHDHAAERPWRLACAAESLMSPDGKSIRLSGREIMLLEHLAGLGGQMATRVELLSMMKYDQSGKTSRSLDSLIHRLRRKAEHAGMPLPLKIVPRVGCRFAAALRKD